MINPEDIQIDTFTAGYGPITMKLTHFPTFTVLEGKGYSRYRLRESLLKELEERLGKGEVNEQIEQ